MRCRSAPAPPPSWIAPPAGHHCDVTPCSRSGGDDHFEALCSTPAIFDVHSTEARYNLCSGTGHANSSYATGKTTTIPGSHGKPATHPAQDYNRSATNAWVELPLAPTECDGAASSSAVRRWSAARGRFITGRTGIHAIWCLAVKISCSSHACSWWSKGGEKRGKRGMGGPRNLFDDVKLLLRLCRRARYPPLIHGLIGVVGTFINWFGLWT
jgi:hypothetical protein